MKKFIVACLALGNIVMVACTHTTATVQAPPNACTSIIPVSGEIAIRYRRAFFVNCMEGLVAGAPGLYCACLADIYIYKISRADVCLEDLPADRYLWISNADSLQCFSRTP